MNFRINNMIQSGLFDEWIKVYYSLELRNLELPFKHDEKLNAKTISLDHISVFLKILLFCFLFSIATLLIEIICKIIKFK